MRCGTPCDTRRCDDLAASAGPSPAPSGVRCSASPRAHHPPAHESATSPSASDAAAPSTAGGSGSQRAPSSARRSEPASPDHASHAPSSVTPAKSPGSTTARNPCPVRSSARRPVSPRGITARPARVAAVEAEGGGQRRLAAGVGAPGDVDRDEVTAVVQQQLARVRGHQRPFDPQRVAGALRVGDAERALGLISLRARRGGDPQRGARVEAHLSHGRGVALVAQHVPPGLVDPACEHHPRPRARAHRPDAAVVHREGAAGAGRGLVAQHRAVARAPRHEARTLHREHRAAIGRHARARGQRPRRATQRRPHPRAHLGRHRQRGGGRACGHRAPARPRARCGCPRW